MSVQKTNISRTAKPNTKTKTHASVRSGSGKRKGKKPAGRAYLVVGIVFLLAVILLVSCVTQSGSQPGESSPDQNPSRDEISEVLETSKTKSNPSVIQLIDPSELSKSSDDPSETSEGRKDESDEPDPVSVPAETSKTDPPKNETSNGQGGKPQQPTFQGGDVVTPITPTSEYIDIRTVTTNEKNKLVVLGADTEDPGVAEGIAKIEEIYASYKKTTGFFAYSLDGKRAIAWNCENEFFSACTVKTGFILYCCLAIDQGLVDKDTVMYYEQKYYHGGSGYIKNCEYGTSFTIERLIYLSLNVSDNIAYEMLTAFFGHEGYNKMMEDFGCERLKLDKSIWSYRMNAHDLAILWRELYFYFQTDSYMAGIYRKATLNTKYNYATKRIDYDYNHKSGDSQARNPVINDGTIIWAEHPYVVAILNSSMGTHEDDVAVAETVRIINDYIIDGPTVSERNAAPEI